MNHSRASTDTELKWFRLCTRQLQLDYDQICYWYQLKLRRPLFEVKESLTFWGQWDPVTRKIAISKRFIEQQPWNVVLEVLKHEMAHQFVSEVLNSDEAHGPLFHSACNKLGVAEWARKTEGEIQPPAADATDEKNTGPSDNRLMARVQKLLALANSANANEAAAAMAKVQELYLKYNLDSLVENRDERCTFRLIRFGRKRLERFHYLACSILSDYYFVEVIYGTLFDSKALSSYRTAEILGTKENVLLAEYVFHFLFQQAGHLWQVEKKGKTRSRSSFYLGVLSGFKEKLQTQKEALEQEVRQEGSEARKQALLVLQHDPRVEQFVKERFPRLHRFSRAHTLRDSGAFEAGRQKGRNIVLRKPITDSKGILGRFLPKRP